MTEPLQSTINYLVLCYATKYLKTEYNKVQTEYKQQQQMLSLPRLRNLHAFEYYGT